MKGKTPQKITVAEFKKKYANARTNTRGKVQKKPSETVEQGYLIQWVKLTYPKALFTVDLGGINLSKTQRIIHSQRAKRGHPDMMFQEWYKDTFCGLAIEFKRTGVNVPRMVLTDEHFKEQLTYLIDLRERQWLAVFVAGIDNAKRVISAYMEANETSIETIKKYSYPNF
jgi:hypothetical protein